MSVEGNKALVRRFIDGFARAVAHIPTRLARPRAVTVVTGEMFAPTMRWALDRVQVENLTLTLAPIANDWFGRGIGESEKTKSNADGMAKTLKAMDGLDRARATEFSVRGDPHMRHYPHGREVTRRDLAR